VNVAHGMIATSTDIHTCSLLSAHRFVRVNHVNSFFPLPVVVNSGMPTNVTRCSNFFFLNICFPYVSTLSTCCDVVPCCQTFWMDESYLYVYYSSFLSFGMHPRRATWLLKWGSAYTHVGVLLVLQWPLEAYHQNHNCLGFLADIW
jgi:hypothetical protein